MASYGVPDGADSEVGSEASWAPPGGGRREPNHQNGGGGGGSSAVTTTDELTQQLLRRQQACAITPVRTRRDSVQGGDHIRLPMRVHLERPARLLSRLNKVLLPLAVVLAIIGGVLLGSGQDSAGIGLLVAGGAVASFPVFLDLLYVSALAPYSLYMSKSSRDPLSCVSKKPAACLSAVPAPLSPLAPRNRRAAKPTPPGATAAWQGPRRFVFPHDSSTPAVIAMVACCSAVAFAAGLACPHLPAAAE
jgi:hypothetical protein